MKSKRQSRIIELISAYEIETQEDLCARLNEEGFSVTQATISRDIRDLALTKVPGGNGRSQYALADTKTGMNGRYERVLKDGMISMEQADNILVIKTVSGMAMAVAAAIDSIGIPDIVGSIAGDDTIMCAIRSADKVESVMNCLK